MMSTQCLEVCNGELLSSGVMMCIELINQCNDTEECYIVFLRLGLHDRFCMKQETPESATFGRHVRIRVKIRYTKS